MKMKRKKMKSMLAACMVLSMLSVGAIAAVSEPVIVDPNTVSATTIGENIVPFGEVHTVSMNIPADGNFHQIYPGSGSFEMTKGHADISGTWSPSYAKVEFKLTAANGTSSGSGGIKSGESTTLFAIRDSDYIVYARASDTALSGTVNITTR